MGLSRQAFWSLTVREFWIKHRAFTRAEDRQRALIRELALLTTSYQPKASHRVQRDCHALRRYPIKRWLDDTQS